MTTLDRENQLQYLAQESGYVLRRMPEPEDDFAGNGGYTLLQSRTGKIVLADASLDDVALFLK